MFMSTKNLNQHQNQNENGNKDENESRLSSVATQRITEALHYREEIQAKFRWLESKIYKAKNFYKVWGVKNELAVKRLKKTAVRKR